METVCTEGLACVIDVCTSSFQKNHLFQFTRNLSKIPSREEGFTRSTRGEGQYRGGVALCFFERGFPVGIAYKWLAGAYKWLIVRISSTGSPHFTRTPILRPFHFGGLLIANLPNEDQLLERIISGITAAEELPEETDTISIKLVPK